MTLLGFILIAATVIAVANLLFFLYMFYVVYKGGDK